MNMCAEGLIFHPKNLISVLFFKLATSQTTIRSLFRWVFWVCEQMVGCSFWCCLQQCYILIIATWYILIHSSLSPPLLLLGLRPLFVLFIYCFFAPIINHIEIVQGMHVTVCSAAIDDSHCTLFVSIMTPYFLFFIFHFLFKLPYILLLLLWLLF